jgi:hypothetical protein
VLKLNRWHERTKSPGLSATPFGKEGFTFSVCIRSIYEKKFLIDLSVYVSHWIQFKTPFNKGGC